MLSRIGRLCNTGGITGMCAANTTMHTSLINRLGSSTTIQVRHGSKKKRNEKQAQQAATTKASGASGASAKQLAQQREKVQLRMKQKRAETKREMKLRQESVKMPKMPNFMPIDLAMQYLRAAEVGRSAHSSTVSVYMRVVGEKGAHPVNGKCRLPHKLDDERIAVFTNSSEQAAEARRAGAVEVGGDDLIQKVKQGEINFDRAYATPDIVSRLNQQVARILGPKGLMPSAKRGTVTQDVFTTLQNASGEMTFKQDGTVLAVPVGRASFTNLQIVENIVTVVDAVRKDMADSEQTSRKSSHIGIARISSTTGPSIVIRV